MATQDYHEPSLAELQSELDMFPQLFILSDKAAIYLTPTHTLLKEECSRLFSKTSFLTPSEIFLTLSLRSYDEPEASFALYRVILRTRGERFIEKEPEGLTKIVKSLGNKISVLLPDISNDPIPAILESIAPSFDDHDTTRNWVLELSVNGIPRKFKAPLGTLSHYFTNNC
ncbi:hypothetical protein N7478_000732 [Penicillium angulare]|uniref:uncharacterized protein n=1 Tax=Penicillium angulare TaxID=116970 RepID=UPI0025418DAC|nr:uncharacterized protein N7478_000732 [Penicillium angulare]KAJ5291481.1 hypothetical protein N7478_000732 [Penicillium angulare]